MGKKTGNLSKHHICPRSRGGNNDKNNIAMVPKHKHQAYHDLFGNKTPDEIITFLVNKFWRGQAFWLEKAERRL